MKALKVTGVVQIIELAKDMRALAHVIGCKAESVYTVLTPGGDAVVAYDRDVQSREEVPVNMIASFVAATGIRGTAVIMGDGDDDVPEEYLEVMKLQ